MTTREELEKAVEATRDDYLAAWRTYDSAKDTRIAAAYAAAVSTATYVIARDSLRTYDKENT
jgi:hypothetical protein